jgi:hypothetical protein
MNKIIVYVKRSTIADFLEELRKSTYILSRGDQFPPGA